MSLRCSGISKAFRHPVLADVTLAVEPGGCVLLTGPSGGGKSTLLRVLALLETADAGMVWHDQRTFDARRPWRGPVYPLLTVAFQQLFLWPNLTIADNLTLVLSGRLRAPVTPDTQALLERLGIADILPLRPHECSLGQRQRAVLARAIASDARYLLLDEPTSALDRASATALLAELEHKRTAGCGLLIVSHDVSLFRPVADCTYCLENGVLGPA